MEFLFASLFLFMNSVYYITRPDWIVTMKLAFYFTLFSTCSILQVSSHKYKNLYENLFSSPTSLPICPLKTVCVGVVSCYHTLSACGYNINLNHFVMKMNNRRCSDGICCPLGPKCYKKIGKLFPHITEPMEKLIMATTKKSKMSTKKPKKTTPKPSEITTQSPETTAKPPETTTKPPETTAKPPETTTMNPDIVTINRNYSGLTSHPNFYLLAGEHCGFGLPSRIAFGEEVAPGELPWLVMLRYRENNQLVFRCGGALISARYVLTAAHCILDHNKTFALVSVRLGEINLSSKIDCVTVEEDLNYLDVDFTSQVEHCSDNPQDIKIESAIPHPKFDLKSILKGYPHDIGLVRLTREAELSTFVKPICMVGLANPEVRGDKGVDLQNFEVAGWGMVDMSMDPLSNVLRKVNVSSISPEKCFQLLKRKVNDCQLCAGGLRGNTCRGDSGGPLMAKALGKPGESCPLLVGVVSYGTLDCGYTIPSVFCDASCYLQWILDNVTK